PVNRAAVVPKFCQLRLNGADNSVGTLSWSSIAAVVTIWVLSVIVVAVVWIVIRAVRIVVGIRGIGAVSVVRIIVPRVESPPEAVRKNKHVTVIKVGVMLVPIVVPVAIMARKHPVICHRLPDRCRGLCVRRPHVLPCC